jgi:hypothetical protein
MELVEHLVHVGEEELGVEMVLGLVSGGECGVRLRDADKLDTGALGERDEEAAGVIVDEADDDYADGCAGRGGVERRGV